MDDMGSTFDVLEGMSDMTEAMATSQLRDLCEDYDDICSQLIYRKWIYLL